jgi:hypothetical protein
MRIAKTFTVEESLLAVVESTKGDRSMSERVNELLKLAIGQEQRDALEREAAVFYSTSSRTERQAERSFKKASRRSFTRD